jgi:hypothetical protein
VRRAEAFQCTLAVEAGNAAEAPLEVDVIEKRGGSRNHDPFILPDGTALIALK